MSILIKRMLKTKTKLYINLQRLIQPITRIPVNPRIICAKGVPNIPTIGKSISTKTYEYRKRIVYNIGERL